MYKLIVTGILSLMAFGIHAQEVKSTQVKPISAEAKSSFNPKIKSDKQKQKKVTRPIRQEVAAKKIQLREIPVTEK